ncbi:MAG: sugar phosphate isomerase/epimerase family protein [Acidimicrobiia bacterium]
MTTRRFGVVSRVLRGGDLAADAAAAARAGVDGMSVECSEVRRLGVRDARRLLDDAGLEVSSVISLGSAVQCGATGPIDAELAVLDDAAALGATGVLASTGPRVHHTAADADARCRAWLERLTPRAVDLDVVIMLEPMFPMMRAHTYVHTLAHALDIVAGIDGATVVIDTGHLWWDPRLVELFAAHVDDIGIVQLTNMSSDALDRLRYSRAPFADGEIPLRELVEAFDDAGYEGWYENEVLTKEPQDREQFVRESREWFDSIWSERSPCAST